MKLKIQENKILNQVQNDNSNIKKVITADMPIGEIVTNYPALAEVLTEDYGFHCVGCFASTMETLEQGGAVHGMSEEEIGEMVTKLNQMLSL